MAKFLIDWRNFESSDTEIAEEYMLTPVEITRPVRKCGDFTRLNNRINTESSESTHRRMLNNPREWEEYHRQYREARKTWSIITYEEIVKSLHTLL